MQAGQKLLSFIVQAAKSEQFYIRRILNKSRGEAIRKMLETQMNEYVSIERLAYAIGSARGWELPDNLSVMYTLANIATQIKQNPGNTDSKIAGQMILRNTKTMISTVKHRNQYLQPDSQIDALSQKLLDCETANIRHMQSFL